MRTPLVLLAVTAAAVIAGSDAQAQFTKADPLGALPPAVIHDTTGMFQARFASVGNDVFIAGQPTERALREMRSRGVTTVINLRMPEEMERAVRFDEAALVRSLGMKYVHIPMRDGTASPYSPANLQTFTEAMRQADGKVLLHCTIAWRASHLWAAWLIQERGIAPDSAIVHARAINLMDQHRATADGMQPIEAFLGRRLPQLGRPR